MPQRTDISDRREIGVWRRARATIARVTVPIPGTDKYSRGTAFLIAPDLALTALHVVANRSENKPRPYAEEFQLEFPSGAVSAAIIPAGLSTEHDWAILRLGQRVPARPLPFGSPELLAEGVQGDKFDTFGFPDSASTTGKAAVGEVRHYEPADAGRRPYIQLYCVDAAAGNGEPVPGLSGAPIVVDYAIVGFVRSALLDEKSQTVAGALYACPITVVLDAPVVEALGLPTVDPLRGLPGLPRCDLPSTPFRDLRPYTHSDAEVFFGRANDIRALFEGINVEGQSPIILVYGQSGVGKSSLLEAGLFPRLGWTHCVRGARRDGTVGLTGTLNAVLDGSKPRTPQEIADAWLALEMQLQQPVLVWIDQVEEAWTRALDSSSADAGIDFTRLLDCCEALFDGTARRPRGQLLLSFRKEFLPEIEISLERRKLPYSRVFVEPMDRRSVAEVVLGPISTERLRRQYRLRVAEGLEHTIAERVCADAQSPVAPTLQIFMSRLWVAARSKDDRSPYFDRDLLATIEERSDYLADFLDRQLEAVAQQYPDDEATGLVLDLLAYHTSGAATAEERSRAAVFGTYEHLAQPHLDALLTALVTARLLSDTVDQAVTVDQLGRGTRLIHDTLAPRVRARFQQSIRPGQRARRILEARSRSIETALTAVNADVVDPAALLTDADLETVNAGRRGMRSLTTEEEAIVHATEVDRERRRTAQRTQQEAMARVERRGRIARFSFVGLLFIGVISAVFLWQSAEEETLRRSRSLAESLFTSAQGDASSPLNLSNALLGIAKAIEVAPPDWPRRDVYIARAAHLAHLSPAEVSSLGGSLLGASIARDARRILVLRDGGRAEIHDAESGDLVRTLKQTTLSTGNAQLISPSINALGTTAAALMPARDAEGGTSIVAWDCDSGTEWLRAPLPHSLAAFPNSISISTTDDGWVIARIDRLPYDVGGTPMWTSSALALGWNRNSTSKVSDRGPDATWDAHGAEGALTTAPMGAGRLAFVPERDTRNGSVRDSGNALEIARLSQGTSSPLAGWPKDLSSIDAIRSIAWSDDGQYLVAGAKGLVDDPYFRLWVYKDGPMEEVHPLGKVKVADASIADVSPSTVLVIAGVPHSRNVRLIAWPIGIAQPVSDESDLSSVTLPSAQIRSFVSLGPDGQSVIAIADDVIRMIDLRTGELLRPAVRATSRIITAQLADARRTLITISKDGVQQKWNLEDELNRKGLGVPLPLAQLGGKEGTQVSVLNAAFASDLSAVALVNGQSNDILVVDITHADSPVTLGSVKRIPIASIIPKGSERFPNLHAMAIDSKSNIALAARTVIGQVREELIRSGSQPCELALPATDRFMSFTVDTLNIVTCSPAGCQRWSALDCKAASESDAGTLPNGTLRTDLLASALTASRGVAKIKGASTIFQLDFGLERWRTTTPIGATSGLVWIDDRTSLQIANPRLSAPDLPFAVLAVGRDGRTYALQEFISDSVGSTRWSLRAFDAVTGLPLTLDAVGEQNPKVGLVAAVFSDDGQWLYCLTSDGKIWVQWVVGRAHDSAWTTDAAQALTGYRLVGDTVLEPINAEELKKIRNQATVSARATASRGDRAAQFVLRQLERYSAR